MCELSSRRGLHERLPPQQSIGQAGRRAGLPARKTSARMQLSVHDYHVFLLVNSFASVSLVRPRS